MLFLLFLSLLPLMYSLDFPISISKGDIIVTTFPNVKEKAYGVNLIYENTGARVFHLAKQPRNDTHFLAKANYQIGDFESLKWGPKEANGLCRYSGEILTTIIYVQEDKFKVTLNEGEGDKTCTFEVPMIEYKPENVTVLRMQNVDPSNTHYFKSKSQVHPVEVAIPDGQLEDKTIKVYGIAPQDGLAFYIDILDESGTMLQISGDSANSKIHAKAINANGIAAQSKSSVVKGFTKNGAFQLNVKYVKDTFKINFFNKEVLKYKTETPLEKLVSFRVCGSLEHLLKADVLSDSE